MNRESEAKRKARAAAEQRRAREHFAANLDTIINATGVGMWDWDLTTGKIVHSGQLERIAGYEDGEMPEHDVSARDLLIHPDDRQRADGIIASCIAGQVSSYETEFRINCKNGDIKWVQDRGAVAEWDESGKAKRIVGMFYDVNRFKKTEESLAEKIETAAKDLEQTRRTSVAMFDASPHMSIIFDDQFRVVDCNPAVMEYFGYTDKERLLAEVASILVKSIPSHQPDGKVSFTMQQRLKATLQDGITEFETWFDFDGRMVPMSITMKRIDYMGSFAIAAYQVDLTAIKKTEAELRRQDQLLQATNEVAARLLESRGEDLAATLHDALQILGQSLEVDRAYLWQNMEEDGRLCSRQLCEWLDEERVGYQEYGERVFCYDELLPNWHDIVEQTGGINTPMREMPGTLREFPGLADVESVLLIPLIAQGEFWGFLGFDDCRNEGRIFSDSEEKIMRSAGVLMASATLRNEMTLNLVAATEAALEGSRAKSDFLSRMSHEIRTPLNAIIGMSAIAHKSRDMAKMQYCLEKVDTASRQLLDLINDVLDMSKIEANKLEITANAFDFERMVQNVVHVVNVKMEEKGLELNFDFRDLFDRKVVCDELRLSQVLINLLNNAAKFTPEGGVVHVKVGHESRPDGKSMLNVSVRDTGIGISLEEQQRLFTAFEQADGSTTRKYGGTGLGLAICQNIVRLMGGDIWVQSMPGKGATFSFEVEFTWGDPVERATSPSKKPDDLRVLVVDDSDDVLEYFANVLEGFSTMCHTASSGREALARVEVAQREGCPYDVVFIDWKMPGMDGKQTARALQEVVHDDTRLVMISVADRLDVERDVAELGIEHFMPKPVLPSTLFNTLVDITDKSYVTKAESVVEKHYHWQGKTLLLVEDIEINREIILSLLEDTGLEIDCAGDGVEAVEVFAERGAQYDLVLMDVQMPRMDGLQATREIRGAGGAGGQVPIIAMTANAFREDVEKCLAAGMDGHVAKPINTDELYGVLQRFLGADVMQK